MKVQELIDELECLDPDEEIVMQGANSGGYVDSIDYIRSYDLQEVRTFYGDDKCVYVLNASEQIGMV